MNNNNYKMEATSKDTPGILFKNKTLVQEIEEGYVERGELVPAKITSQVIGTKAAPDPGFKTIAEQVKKIQDDESLGTGILESRYSDLYLNGNKISRKEGNKMIEVRDFIDFSNTPIVFDQTIRDQVATIIIASVFDQITRQKLSLNNQHLDYSTSKIRVNLTYDDSKVLCGAFRKLDTKDTTDDIVPELHELYPDVVGTPELAKEFHERYIKGKVVLVVGGTGDGKTTFIKSIIDSQRRNSVRHAIIQDTVEISNCSTDYFMSTTYEEQHKAIRSAMRQHTDCIVIGEVRTSEVVVNFLNAMLIEESGLCTFHAKSARDCIVRMLILISEASGQGLEYAVALFSQVVETIIVIRDRTIKDVVTIGGKEQSNLKAMVASIKREMDSINNDAETVIRFAKTPEILVKESVKSEEEKRLNEVTGK